MGFHEVYVYYVRSVRRALEPAIKGKKCSCIALLELILSSEAIGCLVEFVPPICCCNDGCKVGHLSIFSGSIRLTEIVGKSLPSPYGASVKGDGFLVDDAVGCAFGSFVVVGDVGCEGPCVDGFELFAKYSTFEGSGDIVGCDVEGFAEGLRVYVDSEGCLDGLRGAAVEGDILNQEGVLWIKSTNSNY